MNRFRVGDEVKYIGNEHNIDPQYYPVKGTLGIIKRIDVNNHLCEIQWRKGSTSKDDRWWCLMKYIKLTENNK